MNDLQTIDISGFPSIPSIARKIVIIGRNEDYENRRVTLLCRVQHYTQAGERLNNLRAIERDPFLLVATDDTMVNPQTGAILGEETPGGIGEYSFLKAAIEAGANPNALVEAAVLQADQMGRFN